MLDQLVAARAPRWREVGVVWTLAAVDASARRLDAEQGDTLAQVVIWATGEADLIVGSQASGDATTEHYEVTGEVGLIGLLDDLEERLAPP